MAKQIKVPTVILGITILKDLYRRGSSRIVLAICPNCLNPWKVDLYSITNKKAKQCFNCTKTKIPGVFNNITVYERVDEIKVRARCPDCLREDWIVTLSNILSKKSTKCVRCQGVSFRKMPGTYVGNIKIEKVLFIKGRKKLICVCPDCGDNTWTTTLNALTSGRANRCKKCSLKLKAQNFINIGKNEASLLDKVEAEERITILRSVSLCGYVVDGYCYESNTVYEIYEKYHDKQVQYDLKREEEICRALHCDFIIIYDRTH